MQLANFSLTLHIQSRIKQMTFMLRYLQVFLLMIVGSLLCSQQTEAVEYRSSVTGSIESAEESQKWPNDFACFKVAESPSVFAVNQRNNVRTITTRTFRTTGPNGTAKWRCCGGSFVNNYNNLLTSKRWKDALRVESAPFCFSCPCDYYVIALRHIIR